MAVTLSLYIARQFLLAVLGMLAALSGIVSLFDFIELLRRSATKPDATFGLVTEIAGLRPALAAAVRPGAEAARARHSARPVGDHEGRVAECQRRQRVPAGRARPAAGAAGGEQRPAGGRCLGAGEHAPHAAGPSAGD